jgi:predicted metalloprotease
MGRRIHPQLRRTLSLTTLLTALVLIVSACGGEGGDAGKASPVADETTSAEQGPATEETGKNPDRIGADSSSKPSKAVLAEIDEKGGPEEYIKYLALQEVDPFWAQQFAQRADSQQYTGGEGGLPYTKAEAVIVKDEPVETGGCGVVDEKRGTIHCPLDNTIYFLLKQMEEGAEEHGPFYLAYAVAHEWGHHVQGQLGYLPEGSNNTSGSARAIENHADCLAGVWARSYHRKGRLDRRAILEGINMAYRIGDKQPNDEKNWGTPEERVRWFLTGYTSGDFYECSGALR